MNIIVKIRNYLKAHSLRRIWYRIALVLSSLAVFVTTYFLMLPALTESAGNMITRLGNGVDKAITYDGSNLKINVNNIYRIDAYLGPNSWCGGSHQQMIYDYLKPTSSVNTVLVRTGGRNFGSFFLADYNNGLTDDVFNNWYAGGNNKCGTSKDKKASDGGDGNIDFSNWIVVRIECYGASLYAEGKTGATHEFYCVQQIFGTVNKNETKFKEDMKSKLSLGNKTDKGFLLLIRRSFMNSPNSTNIYQNVSKMFIPEAGYSADSAPFSGYNLHTSGKTYFNDPYYEPGEDCLVDLNQEPLVQLIKNKNHWTDKNLTDLSDDRSLGIYAPLETGSSGYLGPTHSGYDAQHGLGFITFSLTSNQQDAATKAGELNGDVSQENLAKINMKLFDYSRYINMTGTHKVTTATNAANNIRKIAPFFSFRYGTVQYYDSANNTYKPHNFWWHDYQSCPCNIELDGVCDANQSGISHKVGATSYLHRPWPEQNSYYKPFDVEGFGAGHSTVEYNLNSNGYPVLDFSRDAKYESVDYTISSTSKFFPNLNLFKNQTASANYGLTQTERSLDYLFSSSDHAVSAYYPTNSILQFDEAEHRYYYNSSLNAVDYDSSNNLFRVRGYVESGELGAFEPTQTFDFLPFNYASGYVIGTEYSKNASGVYRLKEKSFNDAAVLSDILYRTGTSPNYTFYQARYGLGEDTVRYDNINYWFGMTMEFNFTQGKDGKIVKKAANGNTSLNDMIFSFSGDDDVWVFIDDVLVLDLGGTHERAKGTIDFSTGKIEQFMAKYETVADSEAANDSRIYTTTLVECFGRAGLLKFNGVTEFYSENTGFNSEAFESSGKVPDGWRMVTTGSGEKLYLLEDFSVHNLKFFYLERGGSVANNSIEFYLNTFEDNSLLIEKQVEPSNDAELDIIKATQEFEFRVLEVDNNGNIIENSILPVGTAYEIHYQGEFIENRTLGDDGIIKLKAGQIAVVNEMLTKTNPGVTDDALKTPHKFVVQELLPNNQVFQYQGVSVNGKNVTNSTQVYSTETGYSCTVLDSGVQNHTKFTNTVNKEKLHSIEIEKELVPFGNTGDFGSGITEVSEFNIAVTVGGENIPVGTQYYVYTLDSNGNASSTFTTKTVEEITKGTEVYSIIKIKDNERAVIKGLFNDTQFTVKELFDADTVGYKIEYTYTQSGTGTVTTNANGVSGTLSSNNSTKAYVRVKVKNSRKGITTSIDLSKKFENSKQITGSNAFKFKIVMKEVNSDEPGATPTNSDVNNATFEPVFSGSPIQDDTQTQTFTLSFVDNVESGNSKTYYYMIKEEVENPVSIITYDTSVYILTVTVSEDANGVLSVEKSLKKFASASATTSTNASEIEFVNTLKLYSLPTTGANIFLNTRIIALISIVFVISFAFIIFSYIKKYNDEII